MFKKIILLLCLATKIYSVQASHLTQEEDQFSQVLANQIQKIGGQSMNGQRNSKMLSSIHEFASECASNFYSRIVLGSPNSERLGQNVMSNVGSAERFRSCPGLTQSEIYASCTAYTAEAAAEKIVESWLNNPGSFNSIMDSHDYYAYVLVRANQIENYAGYQWFAIGLFSDGIFAHEESSPDSILSPSDEAIHNNFLLTQEVINIQAQSANGTQNKKMMEIATEFAQECATNFYCNKVFSQPSSERLGQDLMSHVGFQDRAKDFPGNAKSEILASCTALSAEIAAKQLAKQWFDSPGHKAAMMPYHDYYAYALVRTDKIEGFAGYQWFAVGLFADN